MLNRGMQIQEEYGEGMMQSCEKTSQGKRLMGQKFEGVCLGISFIVIALLLPGDDPQFVIFFFYSKPNVKIYEPKQHIIVKKVRTQALTSFQLMKSQLATRCIEDNIVKWLGIQDNKTDISTRGR